VPLLDHIRARKLIALARARFSPRLWDAETKVLRDSASSEELPEPDENAPRPEIRAEFVRWLATDPEAAPHIDPKGLRVFAATISAKLDLEECYVNPTLVFRRCEFQGRITLQSAETQGLFLLDSSLAEGIAADRVIVHGPFFLQRVQSKSKIRLVRAGVDGVFDCSGAKLRAAGKSLIANFAKFDGGVFLIDGFESEGEICLLGAKITGQLACNGAKLKSKGHALSADFAKIGGAVFLTDGFESEGVIRLSGARIDGVLSCIGAKLRAKGSAFQARDAKIGGTVFLQNDFKAEGEIRLSGAEISGDLSFMGAKVGAVVCHNAVVKGDLAWQHIEKSEGTFLNLVGAQVKNLRDDRMSWPEAGKLDIDGLVYEELTLHERPSDEKVKAGWYAGELPLSARERIDWIMLQPEERRTEPQPWMQLRDLLERNGDRRGAKYVLFRFRCLQARERWILMRWWNVAFAWLEEAPMRICYSILFFLILGTLVFAGAARSGAMIETVRTQPAMIASYAESIKGVPRKPDESVKPVSVHYSSFHPFIYTLENAVPLLKLGMDERWMPDLQHRPQPWFPQIGWLDWLKWFNSYGFLVWFRWALIVSGWAQATILAAALADRFKK